MECIDNFDVGLSKNIIQVNANKSTLLNSKIQFHGSNNILIIEDGVKINNSSINFEGNNAVVYLGKSRYNYNVNLSINNGTCLYIGRNNYMNGKLSIITSEGQNIIIGDEGLFSFGIYIRTADPHLIYDSDTYQRINMSKSVLIGDHVWLGQNALILKGTKIGSGAIVGAGAVVSNKMIRSNTVVAGNPAITIKEKVFFTNDCVHRWTLADTEKSLYLKNDKWNFQYSDNVINLIKLDELLKDINIPIEKVKVLTSYIAQCTDKNRFYIGDKVDTSQNNRKVISDTYKRLYVRKENTWLNRIKKDYRKDTKLSVLNIQNGLILPPKRQSEGIYKGGVIDQKGNFIAGMLRNGKENLSNPGYYGIGEGYLVNEIEVIKKHEKVVFGGVLIGHFGHMILECFSRFWYILEKHPEEKIVFIVILGKKKWFEDFFDILGLDKEKIYFVEKPTQFDNIIVPDEAVHSWDSYTEKYMLPYRKMCSAVPQSEKYSSKIYLTRTQFNKYGISDCTNEKYFEDFFRSQGFDVVAPESLSISEQISIMYNAEEVATTLGTISHLILFCKPYTKVTILCKVDDDTLPPQCLINQANDIDYTFVDVSCNFLHANRSYGIDLIGPTQEWRQFVKDRYSLTVSEDSLRSSFYDYVSSWIRYYASPSNFKKISNLTAYDFLNRMSEVLLNSSLKKEDYLIEQKTSLPCVKYRLHQKNFGWGEYIRDDIFSEKTVHNANIEALEIQLINMSGSIIYSVYVDGIGWQKDKRDGEVAGTTGRGMPIIALKCSLQKELRAQYCLIYRVKIKNIWSKWYENGEATEISKEMDAIQNIQLKLIAF